MDDGLLGPVPKGKEGDTGSLPVAQYESSMLPICQAFLTANSDHATPQPHTQEGGIGSIATIGVLPS